MVEDTELCRLISQKKDISEIGAELKKCADVIAETDCKMLSIRQKIEEKHPTQEE